MSMTRNQVEFGGDDKAALQYIRDKGYVSYSSLCNVIERRAPEPFKVTPYYTFGKELHSRFLERKKLEVLPPAQEVQLKEMVHNLAEDAMVQRLMDGAQCEVDFDTKINGLRFYGRIDIKNFAIGDLKTTALTNKHLFANQMNFLQPAIYCRATKTKDFYYIGISKVPPHPVMVFSVRQYEHRWMEANQLLDRYIKYLKKVL